MLKCENVTIKYDNYTAVDNISFNINRGEYAFILGNNGSGKSTLIKAALGLLPISSGKITLNAKSVGYLSQQTPVQNDFPASAYEIVLSGMIKQCKIFYSAQQKKHALSKMRELGIENLKNKCFRELSGGQRQRVLLCRALCSDPECLILDEPLTGLDESAATELYGILEKLHRQNITIITVSHDIDAALIYADKILCISNNHFFCGTPEEYKKHHINTKGNKI